VAKYILELGTASHQMDLVIIAITVCFLLLAVGFAIVFARLISRDRLALPISESDAIFSPNRYRVVERLLAEADLETVKTPVTNTCKGIPQSTR
jgi:hypothetical protein